ncbi:MULTISPECIES: hypothetical protein [unclassified Coleofasciculus]|uniref:hypothetical protein n=1 Tax=unclassified Coleofasciculus TaxID=2692782 RepID=UPI0018825273|nr:MULTISPECIES: hypothetical protein [unclassified Coleofasciculus]MBE9126732.1 hypothetical protein [Coleofasciculus sp. LEGE 07081]MBE9149043.1 hypothetical protein [Coleofasciculus sp. LEGE 07092]
MQLPAQEMTGLSLAATAITLIGLRSLSNWDAIAHKLPDPNGGLVSAKIGSFRYRLNALESQIWEYTNGTVSLKAIAQQLRLPLKKVQQIAFRLIAVGLAEEVPLIVSTPSTQVIEPLPTQLHSEATNSKVSHSFLHNLMGFLSTNKSIASAPLGFSAERSRSAKKQSLRIA